MRSNACTVLCVNGSVLNRITFDIVLNVQTGSRDAVFVAHTVE